MAAAAPTVDAVERDETNSAGDGAATTNSAVEELPHDDEENKEEERVEEEPYVRRGGLSLEGLTREEFLREMERDPRVVPLIPWPYDRPAAQYVESDAERAERVAMRAEELKKTKRQLDTTAMALAAAIAAIIAKRVIVNAVVNALQ